MALARQLAEHHLPRSTTSAPTSPRVPAPPRDVQRRLGPLASSRAWVSPHAARRKLGHKPHDGRNVLRTGGAHEKPGKRRVPAHARVAGAERLSGQRTKGLRHAIIAAIADHIGVVAAGKNIASDCGAQCGEPLRKVSRSRHVSSLCFNNKDSHRLSPLLEDSRGGGEFRQRYNAFAVVSDPLF